MKLRPYQQAAVKAVNDLYASGKRSTLILLPTGCGKCLGRGTPVMMFDGTIKSVESVREGDLLMGPDSTPRAVLSVCHGVDDLYRVTPTKGDPYVVNSAHILSLKTTKGIEKGFPAKGKYGDSRVINLTVTDYLSRSSWFKHIAKGYRVPVEFPERDTPMDPYFVGLWLGDGTSGCPEVTTEDKEVKNYLRELAGGLGLRFVEKLQKGNKSSVCAISGPITGRSNIKRNPVREFLSASGLLNNKHIPHLYKCNSTRKRLELLAGLIDADGSANLGGYDYISVNKRLAEDVAFVARSVGLAAYVRQCRKTCCNNGVVGTYYRVGLSGDCSRIPVRIPRKVVSPRRQKKDVLVTGIDVQPIGRGEYFGFSISGDRLFLLGDFTVTHNTLTFSDLANTHSEWGRVLVIAHRTELIQQAADKLYDVTGERPEIEMAGSRAFADANHWQASRFVVASVQTLTSGPVGKRRMTRFNPADFSLLIIDEAHRAAADTYREVVEYFCRNPQLKVLGVTATGDRADGQGLGCVFQSVAYELELPAAVNDGWLVRPRQVSVVVDGLDFSKCRTTAGDLNQEDVAAAMEFEGVLHPIVHATLEVAGGLEQHSLNQFKDAPDRGAQLAALLGGRSLLTTLVFLPSVRLAERFAEICERWLPGSAKCIHGETPTDTRQAHVRGFRSGAFPILANVAVATEGFDVPGIRVVVQGSPTKSRIKAVQQIGRGTRPADAVAHHLGDMPTAAERVEAIRNSEKPDVIVLDFVGNSGRHRLVTAVDVLAGAECDPSIVDRATEIVRSGEEDDIQSAIEQATMELDAYREAARIDAERAAEAEEAAEARRQADAAKRLSLVGTTNYVTREVDEHDVTYDRKATAKAPGGATDGQIAFLMKFDVRRETAQAFGKRQAGAVLDDLKAKRCTTPQRRYLMVLGYTPAQIDGMNFNAAMEAINAAKGEAA